jgi:beta-glucosidase
MEKHAQDNPAFAGFPTDPNAATITYSEGLFVGYRGYEKNHIQPQYPFGYGLSYTTFKYSDLDINPLILKKEPQDHGLTEADWKKHQGDDDNLIPVSFRVTNTGKLPGAEIAQLYVAPVNPPVIRPLKELKGFKKVFLQPGESKKITINLDRRSLAYYDVSAHAWDVARGVYKILLGSSSQDIGLQGAVLNVFPAQLSVLESKPVAD